MEIKVRAYREQDLQEMIRIWNEVVTEGIAFPQEDCLTEETGRAFFAEQTYCGVAEDVTEGRVYGLYILHPNNIGRCGHICNASYAVSADSRGLHIGEKLVIDCIEQGKEHGFGILQFNAVVATNVHARHLYERLGFRQLGTIPKGFRMKDGYFEDICPYYRILE
ncbi:MAG: GNAT family N-acetyltransferase [Lachnospiraceae bacterium]|nr:GNAT family N-acetyltransferase [Lachnospiraceae bacterium]